MRVCVYVYVSARVCVCNLHTCVCIYIHQCVCTLCIFHTHTKSLLFPSSKFCCYAYFLDLFYRSCVATLMKQANTDPQQVPYNITGWLDKNKDPLNETVVELLSHSKEVLVQSLFAPPDAGGTFIDQ